MNPGSASQGAAAMSTSPWLERVTYRYTQESIRTRREVLGFDT